jgi:hypothetical protein
MYSVAVRFPGDRPLPRIGELSRRLGVSDHVLRTWENRYRLLQPVRSPGGLRLYSEAARAALSGHASTPARRYVPELVGLDPARIHTPWRLDAWHRKRLGYPDPLTDPEARSWPGP